MSYWTEQAKLAADEGYQPGGDWEAGLKRYIMRARPVLAKELGKDLDAYCQVRTNAALTQLILLTNQGTPPYTAHTLAKADLMQLPADEDEPPEDMEIEDRGGPQG